MQTQATSKKWLRLGLIAAAVSAPVSLLFVDQPTGPSKTYAQQSAAAQEVRSGNNADAIAHAESLSVAIRNVAKSAKPSVVSITSLVERSNQTIRRGGSMQPFEGFGDLPPGLPEEFYQFFGRGRLPEQFDDNGNGSQGDQDQQPGQSQTQVIPRGEGSGVIVSEDGYILTNNHVVEGASKIRVQLSDDRELDAKVIGTDPKSDIAVIKVEATGLVPAVLGDSTKVDIGDWVVAIGSPFGLSQTVTAGIVSATNRVDFGITDYDDFIQTDAAINPGNSGGPLLNIRGEVIGINTAIVSRGGGFNGIGFAIPTSVVERVMGDLMKEGHVIRGFLGAGISETPDAFKQFNLDESIKGVVITATAPQGPAAKAGIEAGDVVVSVDGTEMRSSDKLRRYIANLRPGSTSRFSIIRDGKSKEINVTIEEQTDEKLRSIAAGMTGGEVLGLKLSPVTEELAEELQLQEVQGLLVEEVASDSPFAKRVRPGEVIVELNGEVIRSPEDLKKAYDASPNRIRLLIAGRNALRMEQFTR